MISHIQAIKSWVRDPVRFVRDNFLVEPDAWQTEYLQALVNNQKLALKACKGPGKTCVLAWSAWWFLATRPHPKIAATSVSSDNLSDGLWTEMAKWMSKSTFLKSSFTWTKTRIFNNEHPETWWMSARSWSKSASDEQQANTLAGLHADYIMFIIDESGGIPSSVMAAAEAALANDIGPGHEAKLIQAGNPTHTSGPLYDASTRDRKNWYVIEISSDPDNPKRTPRVSSTWAQEQIDKYGRDNPWVLINVFGEFPPSSSNTLLGREDVEKAMNRKLAGEDFIHSQKRLGVDVARFGDDSTIIFPRQGLMAFKYVEMKNARTNEIASRVILAKQKWNAEVEYVDGTGGYGAGVIDSMMSRGFNPQEISFSSKASDPRFYNKRAEIWWRMAEWIKRGGCLPYDEDLIRELTAPEYYFKNGKILLQDKDQIKAELGISPDKADALALTFTDEERPTGLGELGVLFRSRDESDRSRTDYDPLDPSRF